MRLQKITFSNQTGQQLSARIDLPDAQPRAMALFAHCFTCSKNLRALNHISRVLTEMGFGVLRFDFTGLGESEGDFAETNFSSNVADLGAAYHYLRDTQLAPLLLVGHSLGGAAVLQAAGDMEAVKAVATIAAPCRPQHVTKLLQNKVEEINARGAADVILAGRRFTVQKQFLDDLAEQHMDGVVRQLGRPLLIFHSPLDETVGIDNAAHLFDLAKHSKSFVSLDKADHLLTDPQDAAHVGRILAAWIEKYL